MQCNWEEKQLIQRRRKTGSRQTGLCSFLTGRMARLLLKLHTNSTLGNTSRLCSGFSLWHCLAIDTPIFAVLHGCRVFFLLCIRFITICSPHPCYSCNGDVCSSFLLQWVQWNAALNVHLVDFNSDVLCQHTGINFLETGNILSFQKPSSLSILSLSRSCRLLGSFRCFTSSIPRIHIRCKTSSVVRKDRMRIRNYVAVYSSPFVFSPIIYTKPARRWAQIHSPLVNLCN